MKPSTAIAEKAIIRTALEYGHREELEEGIVLHKITNGLRTSLIVENTVKNLEYCWQFTCLNENDRIFSAGKSSSENQMLCEGTKQHRVQHAVSIWMVIATNESGGAGTFCPGL